MRWGVMGFGGVCEAGFTPILTFPRQGGRDWRGGGGFEGLPDGGADGVGFLEDLVVPEPDDFEAPALEPSGASGILVGLLEVVATVDFYDELAVEGCEIDDVGAYGGLPAEFAAGDLALAEDFP